MKLLTRDDIEKWADRANSKFDLPILISKLVRATTPVSTQADFPSGSAAFIGGWDGIVTCEENTQYVPKGISLWEFGTEADNKGKADDDYDKRKENSLGFSKKDCVFIFVTPRFWKMKDKWIETKKAEGIWKDIKVYDSSGLEQWLDIAQGVLRWFANDLKGIPYDGIDLAEEFWKYWSIYESVKLDPKVITVGRENEQAEIFKFLQGPPSITSVKATSRDEAIAFIIATAKLFPIPDAERFFSKTLIIHNEGHYKATSTNFNSPLNLIATFENRLILYSAVSNNHHVIVPLGADDDFNQNTITLPTIDRDGQIGALILSGLIRQDAEKYSRESGRNITILKKLLNFPHNKTKWVSEENLREIIPALLLGRWDESFIGDIELLEKLSGYKYLDYLVTLNKWKNLEETPLIQIGDTWRLTSPLDLWTTVSPYLTLNDFQCIEECFSMVFKNGNPIIIPTDQNDFAALYNKKKKFSNWSREGLTQSLILVGRFGKGLNIPTLLNPQLFVDNIILDLLNDADGNLWISLDHELPLISEASPVSFLKAASTSLLKEQPEIMAMFIEENGFLHKTSHHTGLLWALEGLAWLPEYLRDASLILLKLSRLDPGGNLVNRPINSLSEIFKPWNYQTLTVFEERMEILKFITEKEPDPGWSLLIKMLPDHHAIGHPTHKMRWRIFDKNINLNYTYNEIYATYSYVVSLLIHMFDNNENKFSQFLNETVNFMPYDRNKVLDWAENIYSKVQQSEYTTWETLRKILNHHRSYPDATWALNESELNRYEGLYDKLKPLNALDQNLWLFDDHWPSFPDGLQYFENDFEKKTDQQQTKIDNARNDAAKIILNEIGLKKTLELRKSVKEAGSLGNALAKLIITKDEIITICECLNDKKDFLRFIHSFIYCKVVIEGFDWVTNLLEELQAKGFSNKAVSNLLIPLNQSKELWDFIATLTLEIQDEYWQNIYPRFYHLPVDQKIRAVQMLIQYRRFFSAIDSCSHFAEAMPTELLSELLSKSATVESSEPGRIKGYEIEKIFETLDKRNDLDHSTTINLEWLYLPILDSYGARRNPKALEQELTQNPEFFIDVLKWIYVPKDQVILDEERKGISNEIVKNQAKQSYHLLHSWTKIPGMKLDNSIDEFELKEWVDKARKLAESVGRLEVADMHIGQVLATYPEDIMEWPQEKVFALMEEINSDSLFRNYSSAMFNKRGSSSRGAYEGGNIERGHAKYFEVLAKKYKNKYPNVSEVFQRLSKGYLVDAKRQDESAERDRLEY